MTTESVPSPPLVFQGVTKSYKTHFWQRPVTSLSGFDLEVRPGEILGILGPNGAGKTTTIKLALGLIFPDQGQVTLMGGPATKPSTRARVGYLPENPYFPDEMSARELVQFAGRLHGVEENDCRRRTGEWLERVGLSDAADRALRRFSKGMVQRAGMARALIGQPDFVILDEPMSGLDPVGRRDFRDLILELKAGGATVLFCSHVLADAEMLCDRVAILRAGRLIKLTELFAVEQDRKILRWEAEVAGGGSIPGGELVAERGEERLWRFPASFDAAAILSGIEAGGGRTLSLVPYRETLEDLFLRTLSEDREAQR